MAADGAAREAEIPEGFTPMPPFGKFHDLTGPFYVAQRDGQHVVGMRMEGKHGNKGDNLHGGMFFMLLDTAMTYVASLLRPPDHGAVTTSFASEIIAVARVGDWLEARVDVIKAGRRVMFIECWVWNGAARIARGSATFQIVKRDYPAGAPAAGGSGG
jgi:uncharacterized protein (TIGR00369 family)